MGATGKVIKNTGILYTRMLLTIGISLYTTRVILEALGVEDYGIYNLVAGVINMLSFLNAAMTTSTQRYFSFYLGKGNSSNQSKVFSNSLLLHIIVGIIIFLILQLLGLVLFDNFLNIPESKIDAAKNIYLIMGITTFFTIISTPFSASLIAHENMFWVAIVNVIEVVLKLCIALMLFTSINNSLQVYTISIAVISAISLSLYSIVCFNKYQECSWRIWQNIDYKLIKELSLFAGWNLFGAACGIARIQGLAIILNLFFGAKINAAYGLANQVAGQLTFFSVSMLQALNPQIMQSEGAGDRKRMLKLSMMGSKFSFFLLSFIAIPVIFEMPAILKIWLKVVPDYTIDFCSLILIGIMSNQLTIGLQSAFQATGKIKIYQISVGSLILLNLPIAYFLLKLNFHPNYVLISFIGIELLACIFRVYLLNILGGLSIEEYIKRVLFKEIIPTLSTIITCYVITAYLHFTNRFVLTLIASIAVFVLTIYIAGLCEDESAVIKNFIKKGKNKILWAIN